MSPRIAAIVRFPEHERPTGRLLVDRFEQRGPVPCIPDGTSLEIRYPKAVGTPEDVAKNKKSWTGKFLVQTFERQAERRARQKAKGGKAKAAPAKGKAKKATQQAAE